MSLSLSRGEVAKHNTPNDLWVIIGQVVYDLSAFAKFHPGGAGALYRAAGTDATDDFLMLHRPSILEKPQYKKLIVGRLEGEEKAIIRKPVIDAASDTVFGDLIPYSDPNWYQGWNSPYYNDTHRAFRAVVREFVENEVEPYVDRWDEMKKIPPSVLKKMAQLRFLPVIVGPPWNPKYSGHVVPGGLRPEQFDSFHEMIMIDEFSRPGSGGVVWGLFAGLTIGLPPLIHHGSDYLKQKVVKPCLDGEKIICLAITEPWAGSDVANIRTTARRDGDFYIVNGEKKWITNGVFADFFTTAVRTGGPGMGGISLLLIEKTMPGVETKQMKCQGVWPSGTTYITLTDVKVPVKNLIGIENQGFKSIVINFNHERWFIAVQAARFARVCLEQAIRFAYNRKTFGKRMLEHPVIRAKLGDMARKVEATQSWVEQITYQMTTMSHKEQIKLAGPIALLKAQTTQVFAYCAGEAVQILGGTGYTRTGIGAKVERLYREVRAYTIPAGATEIMIDLGVRQSINKVMSRL